MADRSSHQWIAGILIAVFVAGAGAVLVLRHQCMEDGGHFVWMRLSCETENRPVILQRDIQRV